MCNIILLKIMNKLYLRRVITISRRYCLTPQPFYILNMVLNLLYCRLHNSWSEKLDPVLCFGCQLKILLHDT